ncbi:MAG TPA: TonB family protein [Candidatus Angelobacter sp.]|nr:TonB family protein [Candidatus Angelobacter sp.]
MRHQFAMIVMTCNMTVAMLLYVAAFPTQAMAQSAPQNDKGTQAPKKSSAAPPELINLPTNSDKIPHVTAQINQQTTPPGSPSLSKAQSGMEIISDTLGVDFGQYMRRLHIVVQARWSVLIPQSARAPAKELDTAVLSFSILKDGTVTGIKIEQSSGNESLDRAAWAAITYGPLPRLPEEFKGSDLRLRCNFLYHPSPSPESKK